MSPWQKNPGFNNFQNVKLTENVQGPQMPRRSTDELEPIHRRQVKQIDDSNYKDEDDVKPKKSRLPLYLILVAFLAIAFLIGYFLDTDSK
ncbi:hypothetical protein TVAG_056430 [Trichomonas vaginalis G3]|uniref:Transmembrane protein n=1 Tax=Trichomonas vaginalis (strain ATCC PRA-98 / G3) TaxID=412133 RepID=A2ECK2_TRIV3|nr:hypothetical protein TVAGG3_0881900 [Trichomonas vaginalis G3]EAY09599.1 hypothetical protein TVAG_056430 [Trichomonas vaginalis G3]KAI5502111.1 hypothetical protein TVAGG3_0881900 [Trichomonas vaginalis G3]|eukprot:XP_001321822.1 hypothetical protein [Trichomonas vaginalis G3]